LIILAAAKRPGLSGNLPFLVHLSLIFAMDGDDWNWPEPVIHKMQHSKYSVSPSYRTALPQG
jgi:hypothetical protein